MFNELANLNKFSFELEIRLNNFQMMALTYNAIIRLKVDETAAASMVHSRVK